MKLAIQTSTTDGLTIDVAVVLGLHFLYCMKSRADWDTHFARWPYGSVCLTGGKFSMSIELPQLPRPSNYHYFHHLKPKIHTYYSTYSSSLVPSETTPLLYPSSPSLPIYKENVG